MTLKDTSEWATWSEILSQPETWRSWAKDFDVESHRQWIASQDFDEVWFCGAGTSAFIGEIIVAGLEEQRGQHHLRAVATTDLVARAPAYLTGRKPLVVSFGRSGNSSESVGTLDVLDALAPDAPRLNITCNADSTLASRVTDATKVIVLPSQTHDTGFAMTNSFSTMLMTALALFSDGGDQNARLTRAAEGFDHVYALMMGYIGAAPDRAVFLGTGAMCYAAREAALKVMELSAGSIPCLWDTPLGFRHGPKSFVKDGTEIVVFTSLDHPSQLYEADLIAELKEQFPSCKVITIGPDADIDLPHPDGAVWAAPNAVLYAQLAGVTWAEKMGYNVDNPFEGQGTLTRVVSGVKLYSVTP
ncbi:SIS domain-containing protein [Cognatishimia sp.]|uniref:SIS domain-containing protein n=1 Tax=Cognatishimia sp. TaxID=2211648 RepID=UPI003512D290